MTTWNHKIYAAKQILFERSPEHKTVFIGSSSDLLVLVNLSGTVSVLMEGYLLV